MALMDWPVAAVILGTLGTVAVAIVKWLPQREPANGRLYARATDMAEIRARLVALEQAHHVMRAELRADIKEVQDTILRSLSR
jgi:hypothetical protein